MTTTKDAIWFNGGVPTDPDLATLRNLYPSPSLTVGRIILHSEIEQAIITKKGGCRYRTVTNRWRRIVEKEDNILLGAVPKGFKVLSPRERVDRAGGHLRSSCRQAVRAHKRSGDVPRPALTQEEARRADHLLHVSAAIISHGRLMARQEKPDMQEIKK